MGTLVIIVIIALVGGSIWYSISESNAVAKMSPQKQVAYLEKKKDNARAFEHGPINSEIMCPQCQHRGKVRTKAVTDKAGISGGKATGALLTGGISLLATGLSRKVHNTRAFCGNCESKWSF